VLALLINKMISLGILVVSGLAIEVRQKSATNLANSGSTATPFDVTVLKAEMNKHIGRLTSYIGDAVDKIGEL
jgi:hypothetical protein